MLRVQQFTSQLFDLREQYRQDNQWVAGWDEKWTDDVVMTKFIGFAYALYAATARNALNLTLLGGTEIRMNQKYIQNFGVTAATGMQEQETAKWVAYESIRRGYRGMYPHSSSRNPQRSQVSVTGVGSILSEKGWTPILNDALILGAITARQQFALALTPGEQFDWNVMNGAKANRTAVRTEFASRFGSTSTLINAWKAFLNSQKRMFFFDWGGPRVFTRELLGLHFFGYKPKFSWHQLGFYADTGSRVRPDFKTYLAKLRDVGMTSPANQAKIMETISMFLFNDIKAIGSPWPATTNNVVVEQGRYIGDFE
jgi:hypothetical protein